jgi:hypothetical protein
MGVRPTSDRGVGKNGECGLCGSIGKLSWTHVPPECAGNSGDMHRLVVDHEGRLLMSRSRDGGLRDRLLCESCNNLASKYDTEFGRWWHVLVADAGPRLDTLDALPLGHNVIVTIPDADPGAFIRSALAGLFAVGSVLHRDHAEVVSAILDGSPCEMPPNLRFRVPYCVDDRCHVSNGGGELLAEPPRPNAVQTNTRSGLLVAGTSVERSAPASIAWPPLWMVLIDGADGDLYPHRDYSSWLTEPSGSRRDIVLMLPMLRVQPFDLPTSPAAFVYQRRPDQPQPTPSQTGWKPGMPAVRPGPATA